jgi:hypothetical protein
MKYSDYAYWAKSHPELELWKPWSGKIVNPDFGPKPSTQDELLNLHYDRWIDNPKNDRTAGSIIAYFESLESEYEQAVKILGEDYFA